MPRGDKKRLQVELESVDAERIHTLEEKTGRTKADIIRQALKVQEVFIDLEANDTVQIEEQGKVRFRFPSRFLTGK